jgi:predicted AAA+ superfamily ATPase
MLEKYPAVSVTGPRQSGKSTLLKTAFPDYRYISLEDPDIRDFAQKDPRFFLKTYDQKVILDEIQRTPELFSYLQGVVDSANTTGQYLLSGSQNFLLMKSISQSLAGRVSVTKLLPLSYQEAILGDLRFKNVYEWIWKGGYPRIYDKKINPTDYYADYTQTYLERDIKDFEGVRDLVKFRIFLQLCAQRVGTILDLTNLANECDITVKTVSSWLSALETSYILFRLPAYHKNLNKRLIKRPKLYFYDTGLACALMGINSFEHIAQHDKIGELYENAVICELMKRNLAGAKNQQFYFWRSSDKHEVDLIVERGGQIQQAIEIKSSTTFRTSYFDGLKEFSQRSGLDTSKLKVIYAGDEDRKTSSGEAINIFNR